MENLADRGAIDKQRWQHYQDVRDDTALVAVRAPNSPRSSLNCCVEERAWRADLVRKADGRCLSALRLRRIFLFNTTKGRIIAADLASKSDRPWGQAGAVRLVLDKPARGPASDG
jgi:hypothetical protein